MSIPPTTPTMIPCSSMSLHFLFLCILSLQLNPPIGIKLSFQFLLLRFHPGEDFIHNILYGSIWHYLTCVCAYACVEWIWS